MKRCAISILALLVAFGCGPGDSSSPDSNSTAANTQQPQQSANEAQPADPEATVEKFLTALSSGDKVAATSMLTTKAQQEMERVQMAIEPPGSPTARFEVTEVELIGDDGEGAHVLSSWTDTESNGQEKTYDIVWILRKESNRWAIAGMATKVFEDQTMPLIVSFEDPLDAQRKNEAVDQEIARRNRQQPTRQANRASGTAQAVQR